MINSNANNIQLPTLQCVDDFYHSIMYGVNGNIPKSRLHTGTSQGKASFIYVIIHCGLHAAIFAHNFYLGFSRAHVPIVARDVILYDMRSRENFPKTFF